jgi:hypothetical protein
MILSTILTSDVVTVNRLASDNTSSLPNVDITWSHVITTVAFDDTLVISHEHWVNSGTNMPKTLATTSTPPHGESQQSRTISRFPFSPRLKALL